MTRLYYVLFYFALAFFEECSQSRRPTIDSLFHWSKVKYVVLSKNTTCATVDPIAFTIGHRKTWYIDLRQLQLSHVTTVVKESPRRALFSRIYLQQLNSANQS